MLALGLTGCQTERKPSAAALQMSSYFTEPDTARRVSRTLLATYPDHRAADEAVETAKAAGRKLVHPRLLKSAPPAYPFARRLEGRQGGVWVAFILGTDGVPQSVHWIADDRGLSHPSFGEAGEAAVAQWRFEPATIDGVPTRFPMLVPIIFSLQ